MLTARIALAVFRSTATIDNRLFGAFVEHLGRAVYGGIYEPGHPTAGADGFRGDVLDLVRELGVSIVRYPGGNFVSAYRWEDGIGPAAERPRRLDLAWRSVEPNLVGVNEFASWANRAGFETMMALNLGTRGLEAARHLVEYCNHPGGTAWSDLRRAHGASRPHGIKVWCLGNEMDGPWQVGQKTAEEYGKLARETAKALKLFDPSLELAACGSSGPLMPTFPAWEKTVLEQCGEYIDYLSLHFYAKKQNDDSASFLAESVRFERFIETVERLVDDYAAKTGGRRKIQLAADEWNIWYHSLDADKRVPPWTIGPPLLEDIYTMEDALVAGCMLIVLLRHAASVRIACLAQLVNVIAPIMTRNGGPTWRQTIFYPFLHASTYGRGDLLEIEIESPAYDDPTAGPVTWLEAAAVRRREGCELTVFAVNRHPTESLRLEARISGGTGYRLIEHIVLSHADPLAVNDEDNPERVAPVKVNGARFEKERLEAMLTPFSWNVIRIGVE